MKWSCGSAWSTPDTKILSSRTCGAPGRERMDRIPLTGRPPSFSGGGPWAVRDPRAPSDGRGGQRLRFAPQEVVLGDEPSGVLRIVLEHEAILGVLLGRARREVG